MLEKEYNSIVHQKRVKNLPRSLRLSDHVNGESDITTELLKI